MAVKHSWLCVPVCVIYWQMSSWITLQVRVSFVWKHWGFIFEFSFVVVPLPTLLGPDAKRRKKLVPIPCWMKRGSGLRELSPLSPRIKSKISQLWVYSALQITLSYTLLSIVVHEFPTWWKECSGHDSLVEGSQAFSFLQWSGLYLWLHLSTIILSTSHLCNHWLMERK